MGNIEKSYSKCAYQFTIRTSTGKKVTVNAFGMERITGPVSKLDTDVLNQLSPDYDPQCLQRKSLNVDVLLGCDHFGLHPKKEEAQCGENLSIMSGELGICLQGSHPDLKEETRYDTNLAKTIHDIRHKAQLEITQMPVLEITQSSPVKSCRLKVRTKAMTVSIAGHMLLSPRTIEKRTVSREFYPRRTARHRNVTSMWWLPL